ncbi:MAG: DUF3761 domain-containing protein [Sphingomonas sp.]
MRAAIVVAWALLVAAPSHGNCPGRHHASRARRAKSGVGYDTSSRGNAMHRPAGHARLPAGATAKCRDGTLSFSQAHRGTCSHHGGVQAWL